MVYEHENIVADDIDQQIAQSRNVGSSFRSHDREMQRKTTSVTSLQKSFSGKEVDAQHKRISPQATPLPTLKRSEGALFLHYFSSLFLSKFRVSIVVLIIHIPVRISKCVLGSSLFDLSAIVSFHCYSNLPI
ncbi:hypothetical protein H5410_001104 [Solanum commersonii]|uniref:Uncharacterized protein n=1 Tax=Solanum commersonii TaxID=4109 RepID=A0A9J6AYS8_SOLCO|nr:hypothetical protein H5410_001104 [Solanum commersonii]